MLVKKIPEDEREALFFYNTLLYAIIPEIKEEELSTFNIKMFKALGTTVGSTLKKLLKVKRINSISIFQILKRILKNMNIEPEVVEQNPYKVKFIIGNCPIYKNAVKSGYEPIYCCQNFIMNFLDGLVKTFDFYLTYQMKKIRTDSKDFCIFEITHGRFLRTSWYGY